MADDWQIGDLALAVGPGDLGWYFHQGGPRPGSINTVRKVGTDSGGNLGLWFEGWPGENCVDGFRASQFRKIRPHEPDAEDIATIAELNRTPETVSNTIPGIRAGRGRDSITPTMLTDPAPAIRGRR